MLLKPLDYQPQRDDEAIFMMKKGTKIPIEETQLLTRQQIKKYRFKWLNPKQKQQLNYWEEHKFNSVTKENDNSMNLSR